MNVFVDRPITNLWLNSSDIIRTPLIRKGQKIVPERFAQGETCQYTTNEKGRNKKNWGKIAID